MPHHGSIPIETAEALSVVLGQEDGRWLTTATSVSYPFLIDWRDRGWVQEVDQVVLGREAGIIFEVTALGRFALARLAVVRLN